MRHRWSYILVLSTLAAGIASSQTFPADLQKYLNLTDAQVQSIIDLNKKLTDYTSGQIAATYQLQDQASVELAKDSPDANAVGDDYAKMEMIRRDMANQTAQVQSKVGALLTADQAMLVNGLLNVVRLQPLVSEATCVYLESRVSFASFLLGIPPPGFSTTSSCQSQPFPTALSNYLNLTDGQISKIENAIQANQYYLSRQALRIAELQNEVKDLTAAQTIDSARLGADYVAIAQIQHDESIQSGQLTPTIRNAITDQQQPQLKALDNAVRLNFTANEAVCANILVLPTDLQNSTANYQYLALELTSSAGGVFSAGGIFGPLNTSPCSGLFSSTGAPG